MLVTDFVISELRKRVGTIFMVTGGGAMYLNDSIGRLMPYVCCHHEQACAMAAEAYARLTGLGAVCTTTGPAVLNALNGVAGAWADSIPLVVLSGQVRTQVQASGGLRQLADQEAPTVAVVKPITKYAVMVRRPERIRYELGKALYLATHGRPGPVWLDLPLDVQRAAIQPQRLPSFTPPKRKKIPPKVIRNVAKKIAAAKRPMLIVGNGVRLAGAELELRQFLHRTDMPVATTLTGMGVVTDDDPTFLGLQGVPGHPRANWAIDRCDLLMIVGARMSIPQVSFDYRYFARQAYTIMVDVDPAELKKITLRINLPVVGDARDFLTQLMAQPLPRSRWEVPELPQRFPRGRNITSYNFFQRLDTKLPIIIGNGTAPATGAFKALSLKRGQRFICNIGMGSMGYALPAALGACVGNGWRPVVCVDGEGSLQFNLQELETIRYHRLPIKLFVLNNQRYVSISRTQVNYFGRIFGASPESGVSFPSFKWLANAYRMPYLAVSRPRQLGTGIRAALRRRGPVLCEVAIDPDEPALPKWSPKPVYVV